MERSGHSMYHTFFDVFVQYCCVVGKHVVQKHASDDRIKHMVSKAASNVFIKQLVLYYLIVLVE